ncbi:(2Fe-2S)-binding protein [Caulobacter segnis]
MPDTQEICGCNGVCKGAITSAITTQGLTTLDEVRAVTKALGLVRLVHAAEWSRSSAWTLGDGFRGPDRPQADAASADAPSARRRAQGHRRVRAEVQLLRRLPGDANGPRPTAAPRRPALNYYLLCAWPGECRR